VESVVLTGSAATTATGNAANNALYGDSNPAANMLTGGLGDDTYVIGPGDLVVESANEGWDTVYSADSTTLPANVESVVLTGSAATTATGNAANNALYGDSNPAANVLTGGPGDDTYVPGPGDLVVEEANAGWDTVYTASSYSLPDNVEGLVLTGSAPTTGTGNALNNALYGSSGNNTLAGGAGNDWLEGATGNDTYLFVGGDGQDRVTDHGGTDTLQFGADIASDQLWFRQVGNDLEVDRIGTDDKVTVASWYADAAAHIEQFTAGNGKSLLDGQVDQLVSAMAAFAPPAAGQTSLPDAYRQALAPVLAASWQ
jgi:Ca2+-binding RTX toxin-like protein